jgi:hypothetical protein
MTNAQELIANSLNRREHSRTSGQVFGLKLGLNFTVCVPYTLRKRLRQHSLRSCLAGVAVQKVNEFQLYELAIAVHPLTAVTEQTKYSQIWLDWYNARAALATLFQQRALEVCYATANELYSAIDSVVPRDFSEAAQKFQNVPSPEPPLEWSQRYAIKTAADKFETILSAELSNSDTYWISPKGTHKTSMLLQNAHLELPASVIRDMPEVIADFDQAGKCLLFDNNTAVGFHLLRATESVIRRYYKTLTGIEPKAKFRNWGSYIKKLNDHGASKKITQNLEHIRENYRNPILHPEENLSADEAQVLFGVCVSAIFLMANEISSLTVKSAAPLAFPSSGALTTTA